MTFIRSPSLRPRSPAGRRVSAACIVALAGVALAQSGTGTGTAVAPVALPGDCAARISINAPAIDMGCLRAAYAGPVATWPAPHVDAGVAWSELAPLPKTPPEPADNPGTPAKIALGKRLFEDPRLSKSGQIACASCHDPQLGWGDGRSVPFGHDRRPGKRNAMSVAMSAYAGPLFWDGRAATLEAQALHPIQDAMEMAFDGRALEKRLNRSGDYADAFAGVFDSRKVTVPRVSQALAAYQRSLVPRFNRFDRFLEGDRKLLTDQQLWGLHLFRTRARCMNCHSGPALTDNGFHNLGLHFQGRAREDMGRYRVTGDPADAGKFRTPSLRMVAKTGPWMHNGAFQDMRGILNMYNVGMPRPKPAPGKRYDPPFPATDPLLRPLALHRTELEALTEFLRTL